MVDFSLNGKEVVPKWGLALPNEDISMCIDGERDQGTWETYLVKNIDLQASKLIHPPLS